MAETQKRIPASPRPWIPASVSTLTMKYSVPFSSATVKLLMDCDLHLYHLGTNAHALRRARTGSCGRASTYLRAVARSSRSCSASQVTVWSSSRTWDGVDST